MNKILEIIEAQKLFCFDSKKFEILIHPESLACNYKIQKWFE